MSGRENIYAERANPVVKDGSNDQPSAFYSLGRSDPVTDMALCARPDAAQRNSVRVCFAGVFRHDSANLHSPSSTDRQTAVSHVLAFSV